MASKKATNIDEQIALLRSRGMSIDDEGKSKEILLDIGYYRLGFYCFPFEKHILTIYVHNIYINDIKESMKL